MKWCEIHNEFNKTINHSLLKATSLTRVSEIFGNNFLAEITRVKSAHEESKRLKKLFNGDLVYQWTGLTGKELGQFMSSVKKHPEFNYYDTDIESFVKWYFTEY